MLVVSLVGSIAFLLSIGLTHQLIQSSEKLRMLDTPNERSSHNRPTPKGGGLGFFAVFSILSMGLYFFNNDYQPIITPLLYGGPVVVGLGWLDDRYSLSASFRLLVHMGVAIVIYALVTHGFKDDLFISFLPDIFWISFIFCILFISWFINLYNFMDGADGLAASTAVVGAILMGVITYFHGAQEISVIYFLLAYTVCGFLFFNWQPAKIFMGDTGSYFLGFVFASLALICKMDAEISFYSHIIIFGFFIVDATYTLALRLVRGEKVFNAHKQFAFHKLMEKGWSHSRITVLYTMVMVLWLFPLAHLASIFDNYGVLLVLVAYGPLVIYQVYNKAGLPEGV